MEIGKKYSQDQLLSIMEQAMISQCACPSAIARIASDLQHLYEYQAICINRTDADTRVHEAIAKSTLDAYAIIENCLGQILELEGWDSKTLKMPDYLMKMQMDEVEADVSMCSLR